MIDEHVENGLVPEHLRYRVAVASTTVTCSLKSSGTLTSDTTSGLGWYNIDALRNIRPSAETRWVIFRSLARLFLGIRLFSTYSLTTLNIVHIHRTNLTADGFRNVIQPGLEAYGGMLRGHGRV